MKSIGWFMALVCACLFLAPGLAQAQATRTWVSGVGDDANPCSRTAPCKTFAGAISKTAAGGEIDTLDPGGFGTFTITKSIIIASEGSGEASVLAAGTNGININCSGCTVVLRGLQIDGAGSGIVGINFIAGNALIMQNCVIRGFGGSSGFGLRFIPTAAQTENLYIEDTKFNNNFNGAGTGGNIDIAPGSGSSTINVEIRNTSAINGGFGVAADSTGMSGGSITVAIADSVLSGNSNAGLAAVSGGVAPVKVNLNRAVISSNNVGLNSKGSGATVRFGNSTIAGNAIEFKNTGTMTTYGTNNRNDNGAGTGTVTTAGPT